jgi:hypothetical protein
VIGKIMAIAKNIDDLKENMATLDAYLSDSSPEKVVFARDTVFRGVCFVVLGVDKKSYRFYPSQFVGYKKNSMERHLSWRNFYGRETKGAITKLLNAQILTFDKNPAQWNELELAYKAYCVSLGIVPSKIKRKYWPALK